MYYTDATGLQHESYTAACEYYGADTPASLASEAEDALREDALDAEYGAPIYVEMSDPW